MFVISDRSAPDSAVVYHIYRDSTPIALSGTTLELTIGDGLVTENSDMENLLHSALTLRARQAQEWAQWFSKLQQLDNDLAGLVLKVLGCEPSNAGYWLSQPAFGLGGASPIDLLARGQRQRVIDLLMRIKYGIPP